MLMIVQIVLLQALVTATETVPEMDHVRAVRDSLANTVTAVRPTIIITLVVPVCAVVLLRA